METQLTLFDYAQLDSETRIVVQQRTGEIKALMKRTAQDIIEIGEKLADVRDRLADNKSGGFEAWLKAEFDWGRRTAYRFISVADSFNRDNLAQLDFAPSALYLLAAPSTPDEAREAALEQAANGERITHAAAKEIVTEAKANVDPLPQLRPLPEADPIPEPLPPLADDWPTCDECGNDLTVAEVKDGFNKCDDCRQVVENTATPLLQAEPAPPPLPPLVAGEPDWVFTIRVQPDGRIMIGAFYDGQSRGIYTGQAATQDVAVGVAGSHLDKFIKDNQLLEANNE